MLPEPVVLQSLKLVFEAKMRLPSYILRQTLLIFSVISFFFGVSSSVQAQSIDEADAQCVGEALAEYMNGVTENVGTLNHVKLGSPGFNMTNTISVQIYNAMTDAGANWDGIDAMVGNVYTVSGNPASFYYDQTGWRTIVQGSGKPIIFTEFGDFTPNNLASLTQDYQTFNSYREVISVNYFDFFRDNPQFAFHSFSEDWLRQIIASDRSISGANSASPIDGSGGFSNKAADLGLKWTVEIVMNTDSFGQTLGAVEAAHNRGVTPVLRICGTQKPGQCSFYNDSNENPAINLVEFIKLLDAAVTKDVYVLAGPNEPQSDHWAAPECSLSTISGGDHVCYQNFCEGTVHSPCKNTPELDCSYPIDMDEFLRKDVDEETINLAEQYLVEYLPLTMSGRGLKYQMRAEIENQDVCTGESNSLILDSLCSEQTGDGHVSFDLENLEIDGVIEPGSKDIVNIRRDYTTGVINHPDGQEKEDYGPIQKLLPTGVWAQRISAMVDLKEYCWNAGTAPITGFIDHDYFGKVRCMNYQRFSDSLPTERDVFIGGFLDSCRQIYYLEGDDKQKKIDECEGDFDDLSLLNPPLWEAIARLPIVPYATFPVFGAIDQLGVEYIQPDDYYSTTESDIETDEYGLPIRKSTADQSSVGLLGTTYYVFPLTSSIDTYQSSLALASQLLPAEQVENLPDKYFKSCGFTGIFSFLCDTVDAFKALLDNATEQVWRNTGRADPFWFNRIPDDKKGEDGDGRFVQLQFRFFRTAPNCLAKLEDVDSTLVQTPVNPTGESGDRDYVSNASTGLINIKTFITKVKERVNQDFLQNIRLESYIVCELYPQFFIDSDKIADEVTRIFANQGDQEVIDELSQEVPARKLVSSMDDDTQRADYETNQDVDIFDLCALYPDGFGGTNPGNNCVKAGAPPWYPGTVEDYCNSGGGWWSGGSYLPACFRNDDGTANWCGGGNCPPIEVPKIKAYFETNHDDAREPDKDQLAALNGGGGELFKGLLFREAYMVNPAAKAYVVEPEDDFNFLCNRLEDQGVDVSSLSKCSEFLKNKKKTPSQSGGDACISGGFPVASNDFLEVIAAAANKHNVPPQLVMAMIQGEHCRTEPTSSNACKQSDISLFRPGISWSSLDNCDATHGGSTLNGGYKGMMKVWLLAATNAGWGTNSDSTYTNICSIHDATFATAKVLSDINPGATSTDWSRQEIDDAIVRWVTGIDIPTGCNTTEADLPSGWDPVTKNTAFNAINIFCGYIDDLYDSNSSTYMEVACD